MRRDNGSIWIKWLKFLLIKKIFIFYFVNSICNSMTVSYHQYNDSGCEYILSRSVSLPLSKKLNLSLEEIPISSLFCHLSRQWLRHSSSSLALASVVLSPLTVPTHQSNCMRLKLSLSLTAPLRHPRSMHPLSHSLSLSSHYKPRATFSPLPLLHLMCWESNYWPKDKIWFEQKKFCVEGERGDDQE
jgi:hypothetical protein